MIKLSLIVFDHNGYYPSSGSFHCTPDSTGNIGGGTWQNCSGTYWS